LISYVFTVITLLLLFFTPLSAKAPVYNPAFILASSNLEFVFPQILKVFYAKYPDAQVYIQYGSSGGLSHDILKGKEYDIFFAANRAYPQKVYQANKSATAPKEYAQGLLILFTPPHQDLAKKGVDVLQEKSIKHITIANKATAPYGVASMQVIQTVKNHKKIMKKIRYTSDVASVIDNVIWRGDAGFLSKSALYIIPKKRKRRGLDWIDVDPKLYKPIMQAYVISEHGLQNDNAMKFLYFIQSAEGQKIFQENGYKNILSNSK